MSPPHGFDWWGLTGKRVVVVGAGGIGLACLRAFDEVGARSAAVDASDENLRQAADLVPGLATITADVSQPVPAKDAIVASARALGGLDVVVHAVGANVRRSVLEFVGADWDALVATNLSSAFYIGQAAGELMTDQGSGRVIFLSSVAGRMAHEKHGPYAATKSGVDQLMRVMAHEWARQGVTVNAIAPGYTQTNLTDAYLSKPGVRARLESLVPAGRLGTVEDVVGPILFLASDRAGFVTGQVLYVDGGRTLV